MPASRLNKAPHAAVQHNALVLKGRACVCVWGYIKKKKSDWRFAPQSLPGGNAQGTYEEANKEENKEKNRYPNILPCECTFCCAGATYGRLLTHTERAQFPVCVCTCLWVSLFWQFIYSACVWLGPHVSPYLVSSSFCVFLQFSFLSYSLYQFIRNIVLGFFYISHH